MPRRIYSVFLAVALASRAVWAAHVERTGFVVLLDRDARDASSPGVYGVEHVRPLHRRGDVDGAPVTITLRSGRTLAVYVSAVDLRPDGVTSYDHLLLSPTADVPDADAFERGLVGASGDWSGPAHAADGSRSLDSLSVHVVRFDSTGRDMALYVAAVYASSWARR